MLSTRSPWGFVAGVSRERSLGRVTRLTASAAERVADIDRATPHDNREIGVSQLCCAGLLATNVGMLERTVETKGR